MGSVDVDRVYAPVIIEPTGSLIENAWLQSNIHIIGNIDIHSRRISLQKRLGRVAQKDGEFCGDSTDL